LYRDVLQSKPRNFKVPRREERNQAVSTRFANGENTIDLAKAFGISRKRVYQIIHGQRK
jgi:Mor family transcriptional regulator